MYFRQDGVTRKFVQLLAHSPNAYISQGYGQSREAGAQFRSAMWRTPATEALQLLPRICTDKMLELEASDRNQTQLFWCGDMHVLITKASNCPWNNFVQICHIIKVKNSETKHFLTKI